MKLYLSKTESDRGRVHPQHHNVQQAQQKLVGRVFRCVQPSMAGGLACGDEPRVKTIEDDENDDREVTEHALLGLCTSNSRRLSRASRCDCDGQFVE